MKMTTVFLLLILDLMLVSNAAAASGDLIRVLTNPAQVSDEQLGVSMGVSGNYILAGTNSSDTGSAYLFDATSGSLLHSFANPTPATGDYFGSNVAISGTRVLVSSGEAEAAQPNSGAVYVFDAVSGSLVRTLFAPTITATAGFGSSVAVRDHYALVGAAGDDSQDVDAGAAYLIDIDTGAALHTFYDPQPETAERLGVSVAFFNDKALVGAALDVNGGTYAGAVHMYDLSTGAHLRTFTNPTPGDYDQFGTVAVIGDKIAVGAFDDDTLADGSGAVYIFDPVTGDLLHTLLSPTAGVGDRFGISLGAVGDLLAVAADGVDQVHLFDPNTGALLLSISQPTPGTHNGFGRAVGDFGGQLVISSLLDDAAAHNAGAVYVYEGVPEPPSLMLAGIAFICWLTATRNGLHMLRRQG